VQFFSYLIHHGENKIHFNKMMMMSAFIPHGDMLLYYGILS